jgi:hypothetical protein
MYDLAVELIKRDRAYVDHQVRILLFHRQDKAALGLEIS